MLHLGIEFVWMIRQENNTEKIFYTVAIICILITSEAIRNSEKYDHSILVNLVKSNLKFNQKIQREILNLIQSFHLILYKIINSILHILIFVTIHSYNHAFESSRAETACIKWIYKCAIKYAFKCGQKMKCHIVRMKAFWLQDFPLNN